MAFGRLEIVHNFDGEVGYVIIRWFKTTAPGTPASGLVNGVTVTEVVYPFPHDQESLLIEELDPVMYRVVAFRSADGITPDEEITSLACDASIAARYILSVLTYIVNRGNPGDPFPGDTGLRDPRLLNKNYIIYERGTGPMIPPEESEVGEYVDRSDDGGGWDWTDPDKIFNEGGVYTVSVQERVDIAPATGGSSDYNEVIDISGTPTYDVTTHSRKVLNAVFAGAVGSLAIPNLSLVGDSKFKLITHEGTQRNVIVQFDVGNTVEFRGQPVNKIVLGKGEWIEILFKDNIAYVTGYSTNHDVLGFVEWSWNDADGVNTMIADGAGPFNETDYPRVSELLDSLPVNTKVSIATWNSDTTQQGKWGRSAGQFIFPKLINNFVRAIATNGGRYEPDTVGPHTHSFTTGDIAGRSDNANDRDVMLPNTPGMTRTTATNSGTGSSTETTVKNIGLIPHINI